MMTLTLDALSTGGTGGTPGTSTSGSHTVGTAYGQRAIFVALALRGQGGANPTTATCTYNSISMTQVGESTTGGGNGLLVAIFSLANPSTGSNTVALSWTGNAIGGYYAISYYGVDQVNPIRSGSWNAMGYTITNTPSVSITSNTGDIVLDILSSNGIFGGSVNFTAGAGQTELLNSNAQNTNSVEYCGSRETATSTSVAMSWTNDDGTNGMIMAGASIRPASSKGGAAVSPFLSF